MLELAGLLPQSKAHCRYSASFGSVGWSLPTHAAQAVHRINNRPRKCLGFKAPIEVLQNAFDPGGITISPSVALHG